MTSLRGGGGSLIKIVGEEFHLLSYDPRGVNGSIPRARCYLSAPQREEAFLSNPWNLDFQAGEMFTSAENKAKACEETTGEHGAYVNTPQTAADMNSILDAIDQEKMYYWGFSCSSLFTFLNSYSVDKHRWHHSRPDVRTDVPRPCLPFDHRWRQQFG